MSDLDLTPRTGDDAPSQPGAQPARRRRHPLVWVVIIVVLAAAGFLVTRFLSDATVYFYTADEAVERRSALGDRRFRLQGEVQDDVVSRADDVTFTVEANGTTAPVQHRGDPPELFKPGVPVVLEGHWDGEHFASDRILIKHSNEYKAKHPDRVSESTP